MARFAMFEGLVYDEYGRPVETGWVGPDACYIVDDAGFRRHIDAVEIDRQVLRFFKERVMAEKDLVIRALLQIMGKDDIFAKTALEYQLAHMDENVDQMMPPQARDWLRSLGFKIIIDVQGHLIDIEMPEITDPDGFPGIDGFGEL
ncbi:MAG TPA: hypothetical protein ENK60_02060 [Anaerolineae bacterium]|nr:hypothetical protein [Anaerolineae bacterium]